MTFRRTWEGIEWHAPMGGDMSNCSREAWQAPRGIEGAIHWNNGNTSELHYARFVNGEERKAECIELDGVRFERVRTCHNKARFGNFKCDVCNAFLQLSDFDEEPMLTVDGAGYVPDYCPHCGARVEEVDA